MVGVWSPEVPYCIPKVLATENAHKHLMVLVCIITGCTLRQVDMCWMLGRCSMYEVYISLHLGIGFMRVSCSDYRVFCPQNEYSCSFIFPEHEKNLLYVIRVLHTMYI
jgi:hypothetical protein